MDGGVATNIRQMCANQHQKKFYAIELNGRARFEYAQNGSASAFSGLVRNDSGFQIVTSFSVEVSWKDGSGLAQKTFPNLWIEPGQEYTFVIDQTELPSNLTRATLEDAASSNWEWTTDDTYGIVFEVQ